jgi:hypothetical protein
MGIIISKTSNLWAFLFPLHGSAPYFRGKSGAGFGAAADRNPPFLKRSWSRDLPTTADQKLSCPEVFSTGFLVPVLVPVCTLIWCGFVRLSALWKSGPSS